MLKEYKTIVISAGGMKIIYSLGVLQYIYEHALLQSIETFIGSSAGSIISYLLIIGYTPLEIITYVCTHNIFRSISNHLDLSSFLNKQGLMSFTFFEDHLQYLTIQKIGYLPTLKDIYSQFGKKLIISAYNYTKDEIEYFSFENYPTLPCLVAIRMSCGLPLIFQPFQYTAYDGEKCYYMDAGAIESFPISIVSDQERAYTLGIFLDLTIVNKDFEHCSLVEYIYNLFIASWKKLIPAMDEKADIIPIDSEIHFLNYTLSTREKLDIFSKGYSIAENYYNKRMEIQE